MDYTDLANLEENKIDYTDLAGSKNKSKKFNPNLQPTDEWLKPTLLEKIAKVVGPAVAQTARFGAAIPAAAGHLAGGAGAIIDLLSSAATGGVPRLEPNPISQELYKKAREGGELSEKMAAQAKEFADTKLQRAIQDMGQGAMELGLELPAISRAGLPLYSGLTSRGKSKASGASDAEANIAGLGGVIQGAGTHALFGLGGELPGQVLPRAATATAMGAITKAGGGSWEDVGREAVMAAALTKGKTKERPGPTVTSPSPKISEKVLEKPTSTEVSPADRVIGQGEGGNVPEPPNASIKSSEKGTSGAEPTTVTRQVESVKSVLHGGVEGKGRSIEELNAQPAVRITFDSYGDPVPEKIKSGSGGEIRAGGLQPGKNERIFIGDPKTKKVYDTTNGTPIEVTDPKIVKTATDAGVFLRYNEAPENVISESTLPTAEERAALGIKDVPAAIKSEGVTPVEPRMAPNQHAVKLEERAIKKGLLGETGTVAEHNVYQKAEQERMVGEIRNRDIEQYKRIATGQEDVPYMVGADGVPLMGSSVFKDAMKWAAENRDVKFIRELTLNNPKSISRAGQELNVLSEADPENPVVAIIDVNKTINEANKARKENPNISNLENKRLLKTQSELDAALSQQGKQIETLKAIWQRKKLDRYTRQLTKRGEKVESKLKELDFTDDPRYKTWLDQQTKSIRDRITRLSKTYKQLKEINDKRNTGVSEEEAGKIVEYANRVSAEREKMNSGGDRMEYGRAWVDFHEYVSDLKLRATKQTFREAIRRPGTMASKVAGVSKAIKAAFDNSYIFRQGLKTMTNPRLAGIWLKNSASSFKWAVQQYGGKHVIRELMADIVSRPNYLNGKMKKAKLAFGNPEEPFPSEIPASIPFFGKLYKASETAFVGNAYKSRADIFDKYMEIAEKSGVDISDRVQLESVGKLVNSLTGRGHLGKVEKIGDVVNNVLFSGRFLKSNIDFLTAHQFQKDVTPFVRKQAALNLLQTTMGVAAIMAIAKALKPDSVEWDSRSANFGKIRIGNTRFDVTGGLGSLVVLASRIIRNSTKSSISGKVSKLNTGKFGSMTTKDTIYSFFENKTSPAASVIIDLLQWRDRFTRKPPTAAGEALNLFAPMPVQNAFELLREPKSALLLIGIIADGLGIGTNTYGGKEKKILQSGSVNYTDLAK